MKSRYSALAIAGVLFTAACAETPEPTAPSLSRSGSTASSAEGDTYLVRFKGNGVPSDFAASVAALGGQVVFAHASGIGAVSGLSDAGAASLAASGSIASVEPDMYTQVDEPMDLEVEATESVESPAAPQLAGFYPRQWHLRAIKADVAWAAGKLGKPTTRVGILDTGLGYTHPDLAGRVDLTLSKSFIPSDDAAVATLFPGAHPIADLHFHGTHVGATVSSNAVAAAGVTSGVTLVGIKVCSRTGSCPASAVLAGVLYAADNGLDVINLSLGGTFNRRDGRAVPGIRPSFLAVINQVFNYANARGVTIVVSAGNSALDIDHDGNGYKTYCSTPATICVSATGPSAQAGVNGPWANIDNLALYSNFGRSAISVAAPGGNGSSRVTAACSPFSQNVAGIVNGVVVPKICGTGVFVLGSNGTSMASPHVTGLAALLAGEGYGSSQIRAIIQQSADDLGQPGTDPAYGKGRINVANALGLN